MSRALKVQGVDITARLIPPMTLLSILALVLDLNLTAGDVPCQKPSTELVPGVKFGVIC